MSIRTFRETTTQFVHEEKEPEQVKTNIVTLVASNCAKTEFVVRESLLIYFVFFALLVPAQATMYIIALTRNSVPIPMRIWLSQLVITGQLGFLLAHSFTPVLCISFVCGLLEYCLTASVSVSPCLHGDNALLIASATACLLATIINHLFLWKSLNSVYISG
jgi:hypothetical protein